MGMMFGFGRQRHALLEAELLRMAGALPALGTRGTYLVRDIGDETADPETELELLVIHETDEPYRRRADFFVTHLRPEVGTQFFVYTPEEFESLGIRDPVIRQAVELGVVVDEPA